MSSPNLSSYYSTSSTQKSRGTSQLLLTRTALTRVGPSRGKLVLVLVGLPGRGKSFIARKLESYLTWRGNRVKIFNVGKYRRERSDSCDTNNSEGALSRSSSRNDLSSPTEGLSRINSRSDLSANSNSNSNSNTTPQSTPLDAAEFFNSKNKEAKLLRESLAKAALKDMFSWFDEDDGNDVWGSSDMNSPTNSSSSGGGGGKPSSSYSRSQNLGSSIAVFDATNSTNERRQMILRMCKAREGSEIGVVFVESICDDEQVLEENYLLKVKHSPDFAHMSTQDALDDLSKRVENYEKQYETISDDDMSYIKVFNLSSKIMCNNIYGRVSKTILPCLMAWNIGSRPIWLIRAGETEDPVRSVKIRNSKLNHRGKELANALGHFVTQKSGIWRTERENYLNEVDSFITKSERESVGGIGIGIDGDFELDLAEEFGAAAVENTLGRAGRSHSKERDKRKEKGKDVILDSGLAAHTPLKKIEKKTTFTTTFTEVDHAVECQQLNASHASVSEAQGIAAATATSVEICPVKIMCSTMPRAYQTAQLDGNAQYVVEQFSSLNPLDKGDHEGMELFEIKQKDPEFYEELAEDAYYTRFPGGESYKDLVERLEGSIIDMEQQMVPVLVVSHVSVIQCLVAYFRNEPVNHCTTFEIPMETVIQMSPGEGGGWIEERFALLEQARKESATDMSQFPIWGDEIEEPLKG